MDLSTVEVGTFMGRTISLGILISLFTQSVKVVQSIPFLSRLAPVRWILSHINEGNAAEIRVFVAVLATLANCVSVYQATGEIVTPIMAISTLTSFLTALGTYNFVFKS